jgi:hypothetical protein
MSRLDEYLANAEECERNAANAKDPEDRATWFEMAADWLRRFGRAKSKAKDCGKPRSRDKSTAQETKDQDKE